MNETSPPKKLTRSRSDRYIGGVAAGIGQRLDVDPIFVRIAFIASLAFGGLGLLAYVVLLAVMPIEGDPAEPLPPIEPKRRNQMIGLAAIVGVVAVAMTTINSGGFAAWVFGFWPGVVFGVLFWTAAGAALTWFLLSGTFRGDDKPEPPKPPAKPSTQATTFAESPTQLSPTEVMETRELDDSRPAAPQGEPAPASTSAPSTIGRIMLWFAIGTTALIVFCTLFVISAGTTAMFGGLPMAALVIVLGGGMVAAGLRGRRQLSLWLLVAAISVTVPMAAVSIADLRIEGNYGDINETPLSVLDVPDDGYEMAAGNLTIDLRKFRFGDIRDGRLELPVRSGMGLTSVIVPDRICVTGSVEGKAGVANIRGRQSNGLSVDVAASTLPEDVENTSRRRVVQLDGEFKLGAFEVVDNTQWQQDGRGGSFEQNELEPGRRTSEAARERAVAACSATPERRPNGRKQTL